MEGQTRPKREWNLKDQNWSHLGRGTKREGEGEEKRKRKKKKRRRGRGDQAKKVWKLNLCMDSMRLCMNFHALMVILLPKSRVFARVSF